MANCNQPINTIPTTGAQYQVTQLSRPINQTRMMSVPRPIITHHVMIVSTLTHYPTRLPSPTTLITQPTAPMCTPPRAPLYYQPSGSTNNSTNQDVPGHQPQQQHQQPNIQQQQIAQNPNLFINMASPRTIKRALRKKKQKLKQQQSIMNDKIAHQILKVPIENQQQQQKIIVVDENAPKSKVIDDQTDDQSSAQM